MMGTMRKGTGTKKRGKKIKKDKETMKYGYIEVPDHRGSRA
jgi:hypothetical protein